MATFYDSLEPQLIEFIERQHLFFVATAADSGRVNLSPKGLDSFRVLAPDRVIWVSGNGSGNETAAHIGIDPRMTIMFCSFDAKPWILRIYGRARMVQPGDADWAELVAHFDGFPSPRQVYDVAVEQTMTACGFGVPRYEFGGQRENMHQWTDSRSPEQITDYQLKKNRVSIDGFDADLAAARPNTGAE